MKKKILPICMAIIGVVVISLTIFLNRYKSNEYIEHKDYRQTFGILKYETLNSKVPSSDNKEINTVLDDVEKALLYNGSKEECYITGPLKAFCKYKEDYDYSNVIVSVNPVAYKQIFSNGYLWIKYTQETLDKKNNVVSGSYDVLCLIELKALNNNIEISSISVQP